MDIKSEQALIKLINSQPQTRDDLTALKRHYAEVSGNPMINNSQLLETYHQLLAKSKIKADENFIKLLRRRAIRTMSGVAPVAVLTKPWPCTGNCLYCPQQSDVPTSYLSNEPAVMRAMHCHYNPGKQVNYRLRALLANGHQPNKIELIVIGGTWSYLPLKYQYWYIANCFAAANSYGKKAKVYPQNLSLTKLKDAVTKEQKINESAEYRIIGLTLETRPDCLTPKELDNFRFLGCTRVEIGVQAIDDKILSLNRRTANLASITAATKLLRDWGFKITYHFMPALPGSTPDHDIEMYRQLFSDPRFQPDQIKFYPTVVVKGSQLYEWWKNGQYQPYSDEELIRVIKSCKEITPTYVRIIRLIRDIPEESIEAGNKITNLRQIIQQQGVSCQCIRCREAGETAAELKKIELVVKNYLAGDGEEYFISWESLDRQTLFGFCRLRLPKGTENKNLKDSAIIRELHVYGQLQPVGTKGKVQHRGLGRQLVAEAEKIAKQHGYKKIAIISGVGVRDYYRHLGYRLSHTYLIKPVI
ncbi:MAG TPA: tRNA uridine(34) 5-carboxymethylaminomethyl modification radical SAM/GNAT enzyme Elp3 [bacterium]|nr:tRNA uridine(34) 5-carboxymethylaminomethyl modification radical SAM/GNAT enzyme Elp3 [bacterium]